MTYEALKVKAQQKANQTGKATCIAEDYRGYHVYILTEKIFFSKSVQEMFEPDNIGSKPANYTVHHAVAEHKEETGCTWSESLAWHNID